MIKRRSEVSIDKGSQHGRILSITKLALLGPLVPDFIYSLTTYFITFSSDFFRLKKIWP